jgi:hypothetical protein
VPESSEQIISTDSEIAIGSGFRQARVMRVKTGRMRAVLIVQSYQGNSEIFVTLEEARGLARWLTRRVRQSTGRTGGRDCASLSASILANPNARASGRSCLRCNSTINGPFKKPSPNPEECLRT